VKYWINTISLDHVKRGVKGGFTQANHGKQDTLKRLHAGDWLVFYSPRMSYPDGEPLQAFTAIGKVKDEQLYQVKITSDFEPWRRKVDFKKCRQTPIKPMISDLSFVKDKAYWGYIFRFGLFEIPQEDFEKIEAVMIGSS